MGRIRSYDFDEYIDMVKSFHGSAAPGVLIGGFMVDLAYQHLPEGGLYEVICETAKCLPDAVQLLTPCTLGNQRIRVIDKKCYALIFYEKKTGTGVKVYLDYRKIDVWPEIKGWYFKLTSKEAQDSAALLDEINRAGSHILTVEETQVDIKTLRKQKVGYVSICPSCGEVLEEVHYISLPPVDEEHD